MTNWKHYKQHFTENQITEDFFVLGIDIGNTTSSIAYYDPIRGAPEVLDISGGYGKPSVPTALQYIADTREWIFGEYAILNANGTDVLLTDFVEKMGPGVYLDTGAGSRSIAEIVSVYLRELIANVKSINPKATIAGIVGCVPDFVSGEALSTLTAAYERARYDRVLIELVQERQALLAYCYHSGIKPAGGKLLWLDFGARGLRGGLYETPEDYSDIRCVASALSADLGTKAIDREMYKLLAGFYCEHTGFDINHLSRPDEEQLLSFVYGHKDMLFNQTAGRDTRLYYNFVHPPFAKTVTGSQMAQIIAPWEQGLSDFVRGLLAQEKSYDDIAVICTGGGFEMPWAKKKINEIFGSNNELHFQKNTKGILSQGATMYAAQLLGLLEGVSFEITDSHKLPFDIGIQINYGGKDRFHTLMERGSWLWQKPKPTYLISNDPSGAVKLYIRDKEGGVVTLGTARLNNLPARPKGTTKVSLEIEAENINSFAVRIKDLGFGKIYPSTGFIEKYSFAANYVI